jgi:hypothetical protein
LTDNPPTDREAMGGLRDQDPARRRRLLQAIGDVGRVAHRGVVHPKVVADASDHDEPRVHPQAHLKRDAALPMQLLPVPLHLPGDPESGVDRALPVILVGDRSSEERHDPVPQELVHGSFVAMDLSHHQLEGAGHDRVDVLGIQVLGQGGESGDVGEQDGHLLALALQGAARYEDLLGEVARRVATG